MCGIAGLVALRGHPDHADRVERMTGALARRGPDASGSARWANACFGHRRLAIFDLSDRGRQPMVTDDGAVGVVYNGAVYNYIELRAELRAGGTTFRSDTDTEVLLHGYQRWGIDGLVARLAGMFAFAIWDDRTQELLLVRDRLGVKPLLFSIRGNELAFASTVRALRLGGFGGAIDDQAVVDYLEWGVIPEQRCIYQGITKLAPATIARWKDGQLKQWNYWRCPPAAQPGSINFPTAVAHTEELLIEAVRRRTRADVPVGALLSGGIDSALVCWALRESGANVMAYTFAAPGEPEDESSAASHTARELGIPLTVLEATDLHDEWEALTDAFGEPFACASALGMLRLSQAARQSVTVLLTGDGGDDVFLGYPHHRFLRAAQQIASILPSSAAALLCRWPDLTCARGRLKSALNFGRYASGGLGAFLRARNGFRSLGRLGLLGQRLASLQPSSHSIQVLPGAGKTVLSDYLAFALAHQFVAEYLAKVDGATMFHALEARSPFLDHALWEYAAGLPYDVRLHRHQPKAILRSIARRRVGTQLARGRKRGFEVPLGTWLRGRWAERTAAVLLSNSRLDRDGWIDTRRLLQRFGNGTLSAQHLWYAVVLELWLRAEADPSSHPLGL